MDPTYYFSNEYYFSGHDPYADSQMMFSYPLAMGPQGHLPLQEQINDPRGILFWQQVRETSGNDFFSPVNSQAIVHNEQRRAVAESSMSINMEGSSIANILATVFPEPFSEAQTIISQERSFSSPLVLAQPPSPPAIKDAGQHKNTKSNLWLRSAGPILQRGLKDRNKIDPSILIDIYEYEDENGQVKRDKILNFNTYDINLKLQNKVFKKRYSTDVRFYSIIRSLSIKEFKHLHVMLFKTLGPGGMYNFQCNGERYDKRVLAFNEIGETPAELLYWVQKAIEEEGEEGEEGEEKNEG